LTRNRRFIAAAAAALILVVALITTLVMRERVERRRVFRPGAGEVKPLPPAAVPPPEKWSAAFLELEGEDLAELLDQIEKTQPALYAKWSLGYLHARALIEDDESDDAIVRLEPFLAKGHAFRSRALYHRSTIAEGEEASRLRRMLLDEHADSLYREEAIDDELVYLASLDQPQALIDFAAKVAPASSTERRREMSARIVEALVEKQPDAALTRALAILAGGVNDDAGDRAARAIDRPAFIARLTPQQLATLGQAMQTHRHFDRAVALLQLSLKRAWSDDLQFALGRSYFGNEKFEEAQAVYLRGASVSKDPQQQCTFLWHAARAAQLRGDDATAEGLMTRAIAVKGKFPATTAALTQRLRTRARDGRIDQAAADLALLRRIAGNDSAVLDGALAFAVGALARNNPTLARTTLASIPKTLLDDYDEAEIAYWTARSLESSDLSAAVSRYLAVLRSPVPTHFAYFARTRLDSPALAKRLAREVAVRESEVTRQIAAGNFEMAKSIQTDRVLLSSRDRKTQLEKLAKIYRELPDYKAVLELSPESLPAFPDIDTKDSDELLMAMGLYDETVDRIESQFALRPARAALTRSYALNRGGASRQSIYAIEVMMNRVPDDFHPDLLPAVVKRLLYPRYFYEHISADAKRFGADPSLVLSIMREESRFNPRAKSQAAARGLLQFIITTARDIGRDVGLVDVDPEDLYDPVVIIRLGAKYISELSGSFEGNRYRVAGAYNAGPKQVVLWRRMQAAEGDDYFLTAVNFDETKHYIRKVMNSYERYGEIYGDGAATGGLRAQP
jgi:soluble lytic murein transglycosylase-like protein